METTKLESVLKLVKSYFAVATGQCESLEKLSVDIDRVMEDCGATALGMVEDAVKEIVVLAKKSKQAA